MEVIYILNNDCVQNVSGYFELNSLISLSSAIKSYQYFIFELKHCQKRLFYHNIYKFRNLLTLSIPKDFVYHNLSHLTQLKTLEYRNEDYESCITHFRNLISCKYIDFDLVPNNIFHTNLISLQTFDEWSKNTLRCEEYNIENISLFTNLTQIHTRGLINYHSAKQLLIHSNLKYLSTKYVDDIFVLTRLAKLQDIKIKSKISVDFYFQHHNVTNIKIKNFNECIVENCHRLNQLSLDSCKKLTINCCDNLKILIIKGLPLDSNFRIECFPNIEQFEFYNHNSFDMSSLNITRLNTLIWQCPTIPQLKTKIKNNITRLELRDVTRAFDFKYFTNLKHLDVIDVDFVNIDRINTLENLKFISHGKKLLFVDLKYHINLTHLKVYYSETKNLCELKNLKFFHLTPSYILDENSILSLHDEIKYLPMLTSLHLNIEPEISKIFRIDVSSWSCRKKIINFNIYIPIHGLKSMKNLEKLYIEYTNIYDTTYNKYISRLTNLISLSVYICKKYVHLDIRNLTRLQYLNIEVHKKSVSDTLTVLKPINYRD